MFTISLLNQSRDPKFKEYVSRKSGFLLNDSPQQVHFLWKHILDSYDFSQVWQQLNLPQQNLFFLLLNHYGYLPKLENSVLLEELEKKLPYLFRHPAGGFFIPLEFFKTFMKQSFFQKKYFLFTTLYQMNLTLKEAKNISSLLSSELNAPLLLSPEKNSLDLALTLYIFFSSKHHQIREKNNAAQIFLDEKKIVNISLLKDIAHTQKKLLKHKTFLPAKFVNLWEYLSLHFSHEQENIDALYFLLEKGQKGFYRALSLLPKNESLMVKFFSHGYLFSNFPSRNSQVKVLTKDIKIISPYEVRYWFEKKEIF